MATPTYTPIQTYTLSSSQSTVNFSSISQNYTDLIFVTNIKHTASSRYTVLRLNGDNGSQTSYSFTEIGGYGTNPPFSARGSNLTEIILLTNSYESSSDFTLSQVNLMNYSNSTTNKTLLIRSGLASSMVAAQAFLYRSTSPITSATFSTMGVGSGDFAAGSTFTLYGIANSNIGAPLATGGIITYDSTYYYHTFGASGTFTPQQSLTADILVVAGGGGGSGAGGGAGGLLGFASQSLSATGYTITVGAGGSGQNNVGTNGSTGGDSQFGALTLVKGGGGGAKQDGTGAGQTGGSGGGGAYASATGSATSGQGNAGGSSTTSGQRGNGGGGGAGAAGTAGTSTGGGAGGDGVNTYSSYGLITGTGQNVSGVVYYAGGGGGANFSSDSTADTNGIGGLGGGGSAPSILKTNGTAGLVNTGGGGSGATDGPNPTVNAVGGNGGSGVVIIRYLKA
jgi:hypothetical protein